LRRPAVPPGGLPQRPSGRDRPRGDGPRPAAPVRHVRRPRPDPARRRRPAGPRRRPPSRRCCGRRAALPRRGRVMGFVAFFTDPLSYVFIQRGLVAAILLGVVCAIMGTFVVLKGLAFIGDAVSHAALPGVVIAFIGGFPIYLGGAGGAVTTAPLIWHCSQEDQSELET